MDFFLVAVNFEMVPHWESKLSENYEFSFDFFGL
jgi:hypothetical protein